MNYSTNKAQVGYFVELLQSNFPDYTNSRTFPTLGLFPDLSQTPRHFQVTRNSEKVVMLTADLPVVGDDVPECGVSRNELRQVFSREVRQLAASFVVVRIAAKLSHLWVPILYRYALKQDTHMPLVYRRYRSMTTEIAKNTGAYRL